MTKPATPSDLASATCISMPYASQILSGERAPSQRLAIQIYRQTGWKHERIASFSDDTIAELERAQPASAAA